MSLKGIKCHFNGASSELFVAYKKSMSFSIFSESSKSSKYLSEHTFEIFAEKINGYE